MARATGNVRRFVKIRRGGELFWCEDLGDGTYRVDNHTGDPLAPRYNEIITLPDDEEFLDRTALQPKLRVV